MTEKTEVGSLELRMRSQKIWSKLVPYFNANPVARHEWMGIVGTCNLVCELTEERARMCHVVLDKAGLPR